MDKRRKKRVWFLTVLATVAALSLFVFSGCAKLASAINDIKGSLIGNQYTIYTYDNFGNLVLETSGKKIDIAGNTVKNTSYDENGKVITGYELSSVIKFLGENPGACPWDEAKKYFSKSLMSISSEYTLQI
ncbi:MAG: DUF5052 family protein [Firmicutes bacterium]|nr:DUF5052 family protein [Bacillota bacterium]